MPKKNITKSPPKLTEHNANEVRINALSPKTLQDIFICTLVKFSLRLSSFEQLRVFYRAYERTSPDDVLCTPTRLCLDLYRHNTTTTTTMTTRTTTTILLLLLRVCMLCCQPQTKTNKYICTYFF